MESESLSKRLVNKMEPLERLDVDAMGTEKKADEASALKLHCVRLRDNGVARIGSVLQSLLGGA